MANEKLFKPVVQLTKAAGSKEDGSNQFFFPVNCRKHLFLNESEVIIPDIFPVHSNVIVIVRLPSFRYKILDAMAKPITACFVFWLSPNGTHELSVLNNFAPLPSSEFATGEAYKIQLPVLFKNKDFKDCTLA